MGVWDGDGDAPWPKAPHTRPVHARNRMSFVVSHRRVLPTRGFLKNGAGNLRAGARPCAPSDPQACRHHRRPRATLPAAHGHIDGSQARHKVGPGLILAVAFFLWYMAIWRLLTFVGSAAYRWRIFARCSTPCLPYHFAWARRWISLRHSGLRQYIWSRRRLTNSPLQFAHGTGLPSFS